MSPPKETLSTVTFVKKVTECKLNCSAEWWNLYTTTKNCVHVAYELNTAFETAVCASDATRRTVEEAVLKVMGQYADYGAADTEPRAQLEFLLKRAFD